MDDERPYEVRAEDDVYAVVDQNGREILRCRDKNSAAHYVVLLTEAFRRGYKLGYRAAKRS